MPSIRQLVDAAREEYRMTVNGRVTDVGELADLEAEEDLRRETLDRHAPGSYEGPIWRNCTGCGAQCIGDMCALCGKGK